MRGLLGAFLVPLLLYVFVERETADPQVITRREAERMAKARGGRGDSRDDADDDRGASR